MTNESRSIHGFFNRLYCPNRNFPMGTSGRFSPEESQLRQSRATVPYLIPKPLVHADENTQEVKVSTLFILRRQNRHTFYSLFVKQTVNIVEGPKLINIIFMTVYICMMYEV